MKKIPFPQANSLNMLFDIFNEIGNDGLSKEGVAKKFKIDARQGSYYLDTLLFFSFVEKVNTKYFLTKNGIDVKLKPNSRMKEYFMDKIFDNHVINEIYNECINHKKSDRQDYITKYLYENFELALSTAKRRASTVNSWITQYEEDRK